MRAAWTSRFVIVVALSASLAALPQVTAGADGIDRVAQSDGSSPQPQPDVPTGHQPSESQGVQADLPKPADPPKPATSQECTVDSSADVLSSESTTPVCVRLRSANSVSVVVNSEGRVITVGYGQFKPR